MNTVVDFLTHVKGVEYFLAVFFIAGYIIYNEILKPKPFKKLIEEGGEDLEHLRKAGTDSTMKTVGRVLAAPFIGLLYIVMLPFGFLFAIVPALVSGVAKLFTHHASFGWRPSEAYFSGKKQEEEKKDDTGEDKKE
jgi:hypothetical protein